MTDSPTGSSPAAGGRLGRLTYTSFDAIGTGGWQIKDQIGLTETEATALRARVMTQLDPGFEMPRFPSPAEVALLPRRLVYAPLGRAVGWWHTAPAGNDASGRPGNVFAHVLLDRAPQRDRSSTRPIDLWRSPDWLTPYGADAVSRAGLSAAAEVGPGPAVTVSSVVEFLLDFSYFRFGTLGALLDATAAALTGGRRVVLATESVDKAALWLGAVEHLMPAQHARRLFFSTLERAGTVRAVFDQGVHVACVPRADVAEFSTRDGFVVLDEVEDIDIGDLGGRPHRSAGGYEIPVTEWSAMAQVILFDVPTATEALTRLDEAMRPLPDAGSEPGWGLAVVIAQAGDRFADASREAARVIRRASPADVPELLGAGTGMSELVGGSLGTTAEQAAESLAEHSEAARSSYVAQLETGIYARRALADLAWLTRPGGVPLPPGLRPPSVETGPLMAVAGQTLATVTAADAYEPRVQAIAVAALANLCARLGLVAEPLAEDLRNALDRVLVYRLFEPDGPALVQHLGPFAEVTQATFLRPQAELGEALQDGLPGDRVAPPVLFWLFPAGADPVPLTRRLRMDGSRLRAELATQLVRADATRFADERPFALWSLLAAQRASGARAVDVEPYFAGPPWSAADALALERAHPNRLPLHRWAETLKVAPRSAALAELSRAVTERPPPLSAEPEDGAVRLLAQLRYYEHQPWYDATGPTFDARLAAIMRGGVEGIKLSRSPFPADSVTQLRVAAILAALLGRHLIELAALRSSVGSRLLSEPEHTMVERALSGNVDTYVVAYAAMVSAPRFPEPDLAADARYRWLESCRVPDENGTVPVLLHYLRRQLDDFPSDVDYLQVALIPYAQREVAKRSANPERAARAVEKFAQHWLKMMQSADWRSSRWKARSG